jgi:hypothetical protein
MGLKNLSRKKKLLVGGGIAAAITFSAVGAWAYFTTTGSGTATGSTGTSSALVLHGTVASTLYPGTSSTVNFTVDNPNAGHQFVSTIHLAGVATDASHSSCVVADYTMPDVTASQDVATGNGIAITATGTITMANTGVSQDACKNAPLTLSLTSN